VVCLPTSIPRKASPSSSGAAADVRRLPSNARSVDFQQVLKFPAGGIHLLTGVDTTFLSKLCTHVVDGQNPKCCN
jgi:hypothetical protein